MAVEKSAAIHESGELVSPSLHSARPDTNANLAIMLAVGLVGTLAVAFLVMPLKGNPRPSLAYLHDIVLARGPVQFIEIYMAFMAAALIVLKGKILRRNMDVLASDPIPKDLDFGNDKALQYTRVWMAARPDFSKSILLNRLDRAMALWVATKDATGLSTWLSAESARDQSASDSSYALSRVLMWAIPILGFIGTVQGLGQALHGFGGLGGSASLDAIRLALGRVTAGLGIAFDTTLLALVLTSILMFPLTALQRREESLFVDIESYLDDALVARLPALGRSHAAVAPVDSGHRPHAVAPPAVAPLRDQISAQDLERFKNALAEIVGAAEKTAAQYSQTAEKIRAASSVDVQQSLTAANALAGRLEDVTRLAAGIDNLLKVSQTVERGLAGINQSDDFKKTLDEMRKQVEATSALCVKLGKPRNITLRME